MKIKRSTCTIGISLMLIVGLGAQGGTNDQTMSPAAFFKPIPWDELQKSKFESVGEYDARIEKLPAARERVLIAISTNCFLVDYDAEKRECSAGMIFDPIRVGTQQGFPQRLTILDNLTMINSQDVQLRYQLKVVNPLPPEVTNGHHGLHLVSPMTGAYAKELFASGAAALVLDVSIASLKDAGKFAKYHREHSWYELSMEVPVELWGVRFLDRRSGRVLARWDRGGR